MDDFKRKSHYDKKDFSLLLKDNFLLIIHNLRNKSNK